MLCTLSVMYAAGHTATDTADPTCGFALFLFVWPSKARSEDERIEEMAEAGQPSVKRVISTHEDFQGDEKKSKTGEDINQGTADPAVAATAARQQEMTPPSPPAVVEEVDEDEDDDDGGEDARPVATIFHADTGSSNTTQSSLSDENCSSPALAPDGGGVNLNKITKIPRNISHGSGTVNSSLGNKQSSVGNWGWFEEVANGEGRGDSLRGGFLPGGPGIKDGGKRRGLLDFGTDIMSSIIPGLGADRRGQHHGRDGADLRPRGVPLLPEALEADGRQPAAPAGRGAPLLRADVGAELHQIQGQVRDTRRGPHGLDSHIDKPVQRRRILRRRPRRAGKQPQQLQPRGAVRDEGRRAGGLGLRQGGPGGRCGGHAQPAPQQRRRRDVLRPEQAEGLQPQQPRSAQPPAPPREQEGQGCRGGERPHRARTRRQRLRDHGQQELSPDGPRGRADRWHGHSEHIHCELQGRRGERPLGHAVGCVRGDRERNDSQFAPLSQSKKHGKYAQYLVIFCDGNFRNTVGVWKRYSDFSQLSRKVTQGHHESCAAAINPLNVTEDRDVEILPNAITSWRLLKKRQRWYRCLDAGYLSLKVFLLERFLHDILFESSNPQILRDFVGVNSSEGSLNRMGSVKA
ncbi:hypothetical protein THAOC_37788 [Thalassiosira oceanica]|uniref:PX domain-containing protein n=1 Tax=Thalassiosira oceanica TaxID=159749 RepID=K0QY61_THAOC|nr:hypothetical protein THAOC_37788 [Thalassiosira oceanica]|eukprot:EJK43738.1 hypothetical protein THAOC_37788 [Thalassiosira oceanica]